jgi:hypothetical protein
MYNCDLYYELGHVNAAFRHVYNYMCGAGATYEVLERMAQCGMANGNYAFAAKYLSMLERTLFHAGFARRYKALIADRDAADREFGDIRKRLPVVETRFSFYPPDLILPLLEAHPRNAMALQYLMAWRLLDRNSIDQIPPQIKRFKEAGCASIPAYCQEALLLLERQQGVSIDLRGFRYDKAARARVDSFLPELARWGEGEGSLDQLRAAFGGTYTFYYYVSPLEALSDQRWMAPAAGGLGGPPREE